ncbi:MAG TPA: hypothetical protein VGR55_03075 [Candidatus Acidoferrum sp.]|nr:hypothetical protein [Candidatus Acidoferrum sp.]
MGGKQLAQSAVNRHLDAAKQDSKAMFHEHADGDLKAAIKHYKALREHIEAAKKAAREFQRAKLGL